MTTKDNKDKEETEKTKSKKEYDMPLIILTNENIFDIPYFFMNKIKLSKPLIGSPRIKLYIQKDPILLKIICPYYLLFYLFHLHKYFLNFSQI